MKNFTVFLLFSAVAITLVVMALIPQMIIPDQDNDRLNVFGHKKPLKPSAADSCSLAVWGMDCDTASFLEKNAAIKSRGGQAFCSYEKLNEDGGAISYLYVLCEEFYLSAGKIYKGSGTAGPVKIIENGPGTPSLWRPRDGNLFFKDLNENFPAALLPRAQDYDISSFEKISQINRERAKQFFGGDFDYKIEAYITGIDCERDVECATPGEYLLMSRCPFTSMCVGGKCAVICPNFQEGLRFEK